MDEKSGLMRQLAAAQDLAKDLPKWKRVGVEVETSDAAHDSATRHSEKPTSIDLK